MLIVTKKKKKWKYLKNLNPEIKVITPNEFSKTSDTLNVIRWGTTTTFKINKINTLNPRKAIKNASNKHTSRKIWQEANLSHVELSENLPCVVRPKYHMQGKNFYYCETKEQLLQAKSLCKKGFYCSKYINKDSEYRVHVAHGLVLLVQIKLPTFVTKKTLNWNHTNGFRFKVLKWNEIPKGLAPLAVKGTEALGLDFGAVDILEKDKIFYLLEVNTAPKLEGYTLKKYSQYFSWIKKKGIKTKHFENVKKYIFREITNEN